MDLIERDNQTKSFLKSLGFPDLNIHHSVNHYDFKKKGRRTLVIGPMGSGKTEFSARIYRDSQIALRKSDKVGELTTDNGADRRIVFYIRSKIDKKRFQDYPEDALAYRGGYVRLGNNIAGIEDSFGLEEVLKDRPDAGTWVVDEAGFFDERIVYVILKYSEKYNYNFIFPMLILNFRKDIFNRTSRLLMEIATDVFPLTAYCEHDDCIADSYYTYRYYIVDGVECPALYFDPLIIVGGDKITADPKIPNYSTRCDRHHNLPAKEYTFLILKSLGDMAYNGNIKPILRELKNMKYSIKKSEIYGYFEDRFNRPGSGTGGKTGGKIPVMMNALKPECIAEKALLYLFAEENVLSMDQMRYLAKEIDGDMDYINERLVENRRLKI